MPEPIEATLCCIRGEKGTLFVHRNKDPKDIHFGKYVFPGGKLRRGELPYRGGIREVKEETGLALLRVYTRGTVLFDNQGRLLGGKYNPKDWNVHVYFASKFTGRLKRKCESGEILWIPDSDLLKIEMHEADRIILGLLQTGRNFDATIRYRGEHVKSIEASLS